MPIKQKPWILTYFTFDVFFLQCLWHICIYRFFRKMLHHPHNNQMSGQITNHYPISSLTRLPRTLFSAASWNWSRISTAIKSKPDGANIPYQNVCHWKLQQRKYHSSTSMNGNASSVYIPVMLLYWMPFSQTEWISFWGELEDGTRATCCLENFFVELLQYLIPTLRFVLCEIMIERFGEVLISSLRMYPIW